MLNNTNDRTEAIRRHLRERTERFNQENITIELMSLNATGDFAICSVRQSRRGLRHRRYTVEGLVLQAEKAMAPLLTIGITTLIHVKHTDNGNEAPALDSSFSVYDWVRHARAWFGFSKPALN